ncbi:MAG: hypothetical protein ACLR8P_08730 [Clostridium fessum]
MNRDTEYGTRTGDRIDAGCHFSRPDQNQTQRAGTEGVDKGSEDRIQRMIKPPMRTCSSMQSIRMVSKEAGTETDVDFVRAGLTEPVSFEKNRF